MKSKVFGLAVAFDFGFYQLDLIGFAGAIATIYVKSPSTILTKGKMEKSEKKRGPARKVTYNPKRFYRNIWRPLRDNVEELHELDMMDLAKSIGRLIRFLRAERPELCDQFEECLWKIIDPAQCDGVDLDGPLFYVGDNACLTEEYKRVESDDI